MRLFIIENHESLKKNASYPTFFYMVGWKGNASVKGVKVHSMIFLKNHSNVKIKTHRSNALDLPPSIRQRTVTRTPYDNISAYWLRNPFQSAISSATDQCNLQNGRLSLPSPMYPFIPSLSCSTYHYTGAVVMVYGTCAPARKQVAYATVIKPFEPLLLHSPVVVTPPFAPTSTEFIMH